MARQIRKGVGKKTKKAAPNGVVHIQSTFNNTIVTISSTSGETVSWASSGAIGFKGAKKGTPFAAQIAAEKASKEAVGQGMKKAEVLVNGPGAGRETAIRALQAAGLEIVLIRDAVLLKKDVFKIYKKNVGQSKLILWLILIFHA
jgi:small subunit ribosomal protein S11